VCGGAGFSLVCILLLSKQQQKLFFWLGLTGLLVFLFQLIAVILAFVLRNNIETDFNKVSGNRDGILEHQFEKRLESFALCYSQSFYWRIFEENLKNSDFKIHTIKSTNKKNQVYL
jgi:hypothetical protein